MNKSNELATVFNRLQEYGIGIQENIPTLLRVKLVKKAITAGQKDKNLFEAMKQITESNMENFKGDEQLFNRLYNLLVDVDIFAFMSFWGNSEKDYSRAFQLPQALCQLIDDKIAEDTGDKVLFPEAEYILSGIVELAEKYPNKRFVIPTMNPVMFQLQTLAYESYPNVDVVCTNIYDADFTDEKYDFIFSFPALNMKNISNKGVFIDQYSDLIAAENLLRVLSSDGRLIILLPARITFGGGSAERMRRFIEQNYRIDTISAMPNGLLYPFTGIRTYLLEFTEGVTKEIQVNAYESSQKNLKDGMKKMFCCKQRMVSREELEELGNWNIELLWAEKDEAMEQYQNSSLRKVKLEEVAEVFRGKAVKDKNDAGNIGIINISNVIGVNMDYSEIEYFDDEVRNVMKYELKTGDVLFTNRGTAIRSGVFKEQNKICIPSANLTVIRPGAMLNGKYLSIFMESPVGQKLLKSIQRGVSILNINHKDLCELMIPLPSLYEQERIVAEYEEEMNLYQKVTTEAKERWDMARINLYKKLY